jgi:hypothetical protein
VPFTPFHLGPALLAKGVAPAWFSVTAFAATQVVIDLESLYYLSTHQYPVHRELHTFVGATLAAAATALVLLGARRVARRATAASAPKTLRTLVASELAPEHS